MSSMIYNDYYSQGMHPEIVYERPIGLCMNMYIFYILTSFVRILVAWSEEQRSLCHVHLYPTRFLSEECKHYDYDYNWQDKTLKGNNFKIAFASFASFSGCMLNDEDHHHQSRKTRKNSVNFRNHSNVFWITIKTGR